MEATKRADERDILFCRLGYVKGTHSHSEYYSRNPTKLKQDEIFRSKPVMGGDDAIMYDPLLSPIPNASFAFLADIKHLSSGTPTTTPVKADPLELTSIVKGLAKYYGAVLVGITKLEPEHYYSHKGRPAAEYGKEVIPEFPYAIVFAVEMEKEMILTAPRVPESIAVTKGYVNAAIIGMIISYYIRELGYNARNNMDGNYIMPMPLVAQSAGLGEIGQNGLLITKEYGPLIRLGAISTDLPLIADTTQSIGIKEYCKLCMRCKKSCLGKAIMDDVADFNGDKCFTMWQKIGTDCGVCLSSCPFSQKIEKEFTDLLETDQGREELLRYCDRNYPLKNFSQEAPDWLRRDL